MMSILTKKKLHKKELMSSVSARRLMRICNQTTDRIGTVLDKSAAGCTQISYLVMELVLPGDQNIKIWLHITMSPYSNGHCETKVWFKKKLVFHAEGEYMGTPYKVKAKTYVKGVWKDKIVKQSKLCGVDLTD